MLDHTFYKHIESEMAHSACSVIWDVVLHLGNKFDLI